MGKVAFRSATAAGPAKPSRRRTPCPRPPCSHQSPPTRALVDADAARALLERVIQRIFAAGLLLHAAPGHGHAARRHGPALVELDGALSDIRATVLSWPARPGNRRDHEPIDELGTAISHLSIVAEIVRPTLMPPGR